MPDARWDERLHLSGVGAIYLHVPFCARKCAYCDFASWATDSSDEVVASYRDALACQLQEAAELGIVCDARTAYVGGGTPTLLGESLGEVVAAVRDAAPGIVELTCEANPDSLSDATIDAVTRAGATRLSIGVQSLVDGELAELGRLHDAQAARERVAAAVASGLDVSVDLMCAIPRQTSESWDETIRGALSLGVGHVSVYPLAIEEGTPLSRRVGDETPAWNDTDVQAERMTHAGDVLSGAGLARYEVASYAREGKRCLHNIAYWTGVPYLGIGTGAASMLTREGYERLRGVCGSLPVSPSDAARARLSCTTERQRLGRLRDAAFSVEFLSEREAAAEDLMLGARLACGLSAELVDHARSVIGGRVDDVLEGCVADGLLAVSAGRLAPTDTGWLLGNELYGRLWDLAD